MASRARTPGGPAITVGPRRTEKLSEVLAREIVRDLRGLEPATMLPSEAVMLEKYGVGRASLREALRLLEVQGLIVIRPGPGGGPMAAQADSVHYGRTSSLYFHMLGATYHDVVAARAVIEPALARVVAEEQNPEHLAALEAFLEGQKENTAESGTDDDYARYVADSSGFHAMLAGLAGNPVLSLSAHSLQDVLLDRVYGLFPPEERQRVEEVHAKIAKAIIKGDATGVEQMMRVHMLEYVQYAEERHPGMMDETVDWH
jgi:GntR family transcriptional regulator, transcriptional repressor for pyruvate dehydrogenase complex